MPFLSILSLQVSISSSLFSRLGVSCVFFFFLFSFGLLSCIALYPLSFFVFDTCLTHNAKALQYYPISMMILCNSFAVLFDLISLRGLETNLLVPGVLWSMIISSTLRIRNAVSGSTDIYFHRP